MKSSAKRPLLADQHFANMHRWLGMEGEAERERLAQRRKAQSSDTAERTGETLLDLVIRTHTTGLGGRYLITMAKRRSPDRMPWNRFKVGSPILLSDNRDDDGESLQGVVSACRVDSLEVAVDDWPSGDRFRLDLSPDEVTRKRQAGALQSAAKAKGRFAQLRDLLLGEREPTFHSNMKPPMDISQRLNPSQHDAIRHALASNDLAIIHGPPGTGKTTTVVEVIRLLVARGKRVLACAPSNTAVDNLLERLLALGEPAVRLGHPARVSEDLRQHSLDALVGRHESMMVVHQMMREAEQIERKADRYTRGRPAPGFRGQQRQEARELKRHARILEKQAISDLLKDARVICATTTFDDSVLDDLRFDVLVIDEACQSVEPGCWVPLHRAGRLILAGDHLQLPPTILSDEAKREGYAVSMMERLINHYGDLITRQLTVQYRMHESIMGFSSEHFYNNSLTADESVRRHVLSDLPRIHSNLVSDDPVTFIDTAGTGWQEELEPEGLSKRNPEEGRLVLKQVNALCEAGLAPSDIAVIAPYAAQVRWLRENAIYDQLEIDTVDGFQGREKEAVVISLVRSNSIGEIGFLSDARRMNVALTRAKRKMIIVGDSATLASDKFFQSLLAWIEETGSYRTAWEFAE
ncbi:MAG: AAA domain-containing protein [Planctomycetota bacterium]|nr:AAA domain-containing protein [Planctomycetota bacterium]